MYQTKKHAVNGQITLIESDFQLINITALKELGEKKFRKSIRRQNTSQMCAAYYYHQFPVPGSTKAVTFHPPSHLMKKL